MELLTLLPDVKKRVELKNIHETWYFDNQRKENEKTTTNTTKTK